MAFFDIELEPGLTGFPGAEVRSVKGMVGNEVTIAFVNGSRSNYWPLTWRNLKAQSTALYQIMGDEAVGATRSVFKVIKEKRDGTLSDSILRHGGRSGLP